MTHSTDDIRTYNLYKRANVRDLPDPGKANLMDLAAEAEQCGELAFLSEPNDVKEKVPAALIERALALAPRTTIQPNRMTWRQIITAALTVLAFGSGSYALAASFTPAVGESDPLSTQTTDLFDAASNSGFLAFE